MGRRIGFTGLLVIAIIAGVNVYLFSSHSASKMKESEHGLAEALLKSFKFGSMLYEDTQMRSPQKFSDFVKFEGNESPPQTYSLELVKHRMIEPDSPDDLETNQLRVVFKSGLKATYYLSGSDVTVIYNP